MNLENKIILVTKAGCFIGSHLVSCLILAGYNVRTMEQFNFQNNWVGLKTYNRTKKKLE
jgi:nucleoside-diphosphate-sugar epimerase